MPSDILGTEILNNNKEGFSFIKGPIFCQLLMIDEVNRASPRTQSAFLQAMEEKEISISGKNFSLPRPFLVLATQNPIEQEGTYNLPEAQLDRFLMKIKLIILTKKLRNKYILQKHLRINKKIKE